MTENNYVTLFGNWIEPFLEDYDWDDMSDEQVKAHLTNILEQSVTDRTRNSVNAFLKKGATAENLGEYTNVDDVRLEQFNDTVNSLDESFSSEDLEGLRDEFEVKEAPQKSIVKLQKRIDKKKEEEDIEVVEELGKISFAEALEDQILGEAEGIATQAIRELDPNTFTDWKEEQFGEIDENIKPFNKAAAKRIKEELNDIEDEVVREKDIRDDLETERREARLAK